MNSCIFQWCKWKQGMLFIMEVDHKICICVEVLAISVTFSSTYDSSERSKCDWKQWYNLKVWLLLSLPTADLMTKGSSLCHCLKASKILVCKWSLKQTVPEGRLHPLDAESTLKQAPWPVLKVYWIQVSGKLSAVCWLWFVLGFSHRGCI